MKKLFLSIIVIAMFLVGCSSTVNEEIVVYGDIVETISLNDSITIEALLEKVEPVFELEKIALISRDGFMIKLSVDECMESAIEYSVESGYHFVSEKHPVNSKIKFINKIVLIGNKDNPVIEDYSIYSFNIIDAQKMSNDIYTYGELHTGQVVLFPKLDGLSDNTVDGESYHVEVMKQKYLIDLSGLTDSKYILAMMRDGTCEYLSVADVYLDIVGNRIDLLTKNKTVAYLDVIGIIANPPEYSITDIREDIDMYIKNDNVMLIYLDGYTYNQYLTIKDSDYFIAKDTSKMNVMYKPVTNVGFASMVTGSSPIDTGVFNRSYREVLVDSVFNDYDSILIEGNVSILDLEIEAILNIDENENGYTDDEIYNTALQYLNQKEFTLVHFHSLDEFGHSYSPDDEKTLDQLELLDGYIQDLTEKFNGKVLLCTDHGMHETLDGGSHGEFIVEDMIVPYTVLK